MGAIELNKVMSELDDHQFVDTINMLFSKRFDRLSYTHIDYEVREVQRLFNEIWGQLNQK